MPFGSWRLCVPEGQMRIAQPFQGWVSTPTDPSPEEGVKKFENRKNPCEFLRKMKGKFLESQFFHTFEGRADLKAESKMKSAGFQPSLRD
jgi:hypothetical protein